MNVNTILFDLDDTLLGNNMERFLPRYFALLGDYARPLFADSQELLRELLYGTQAMIRNTDRTLTNREVFWGVFAERTGLEPVETEAFFNRFYDESFSALQAVTELRPAAVRIIDRALARGYQLAVATNPLFPARAIEHRLAWAGLPLDDYPFALITSYENMHATKPHQAYYEEILQRLGADAATTLMVGDSWQNDVEPAAALGMPVYWIAGVGAAPPEETPIAGVGDLDAFERWFFAEGPQP